MPAGAYCIRKACPDDLGLLPQIEREAGRLFADVDLAGITDHDATSIEDFAVCEKEGLLWVATDRDDVPVGFAYVEMVGGQPHLDELDVHPDHGRRGIGAALVRTVIEWGRSNGHTGLTLTTFREVPWNMPFYARLGFRVVAAADLTPELRQIVDDETRRGLPPEERVVMRHDLTEEDSDGLIAGSCLCGGVQFDIRRAVGPFELCHCPRCRKASGSAFVAGLGVRVEDYRLLAGAELITRYEAPIRECPPAYRVAFCSRCGSPVPDPPADGSWFEIPAGLLDGDPLLRPDKHIFVECKSAWFEIADSLPRFTKRQLVEFRRSSRRS
jgi:GNAT superfamily N-acetyltransferase